MGRSTLVNVFTALGGNSHCWRQTFLPDTKNVLGRVHVAIMRRAAVRTPPLSYLKTCDTFGASDASAIGTGLRREILIDLNKSRPVPAGFVSELRFQNAPARVQNGLRHPGFNELGRSDIADDNQRVLGRDLRGPLVKVVTPRIGNLGMDRPDTGLIPGSLSNGERILILSKVPERGDLRPVAAYGQGFKPEINPDLAVAGGKIVSDLALKADVPAPASILQETASFEDAVNLSRLPEVEPTPEVDDVRTIDANGARNERHPPKRSLRPKTSPKTRTSPVSVARGDELRANSVDGIRVEAEFGRCLREFHKIKMRRPTNGQPGTAPPLRLTLRLNAEIPHLIAANGMASQMLSGRRVLDTEFEGEDHATILRELHWNGNICRDSKGE